MPRFMDDEVIYLMARDALAHTDPDAMRDELLFSLLVEVADAYVRELEKMASDDPAPFFGGTTPMQAALIGLQENLNMIREDHT